MHTIPAYSEVCFGAAQPQACCSVDLSGDWLQTWMQVLALRWLSNTHFFVAATVRPVTRILRMSARCCHCAAMTSISTSASFGRRDTCTVERAGGADVKYLAYTSFIAVKSFMSFKKTVVFTM